MRMTMAAGVGVATIAIDPLQSLMSTLSRHRVVSHLVPRYVWSVILVTLSACRVDSASNASLRRILSDGSARLLVVGELEDTASALGIVIAARIMADSGVAILDATEPHLKVFGKDGRLRWSALPTGHGPEEVATPTALAALGKDRLLVLDNAGNARLFASNGAFLNSFALGDNVRAVSAISVCGDSMIVYGYQHGGAVSHWLHLYAGARDSLIYERHLYTDTARRIGAAGLAYGLSSDGKSVVVRHPQSEGRVLRWQCGDKLAQSLKARSTVVIATPSGSVGVMGPEETRALGGLVLIDSITVEVNIIVTGETANFATEFLLSGSSRKGHWRIPGFYSVLDSRAGLGVLFHEPEPFPRVFLVDERRLREALR